MNDFLKIALIAFVIASVSGCFALLNIATDVALGFLLGSAFSGVMGLGLWLIHRAFWGDC